MLTRWTTGGLAAGMATAAIVLSVNSTAAARTVNHAAVVGPHKVTAVTSHTKPAKTARRSSRRVTLTGNYCIAQGVQYPAGWTLEQIQADPGTPPPAHCFDTQAELATYEAANGIG